MLSPKRRWGFLEGASPSLPSVCMRLWVQNWVLVASSLRWMSRARRRARPLRGIGDEQHTRCSVVITYVMTTTVRYAESAAPAERIVGIFTSLNQSSKKRSLDAAAVLITGLCVCL